MIIPNSWQSRWYNKLSVPTDKADGKTAWKAVVNEDRIALATGSEFLSFLK